MKWFIIRRLLQVIPLLFIIIIINFTIIRMAPGDPITFLIGGRYASPEYIASLKQDFGLDKSLPEQLVTYMSNVLQGNLGKSIHHFGRPVRDVILEKLPATLLMMGLAAVFSILGGGHIRDNCF